MPELYEAVEANSQRAAAATKKNHNKQKLSVIKCRSKTQLRAKRNVSRSLSPLNVGPYVMVRPVFDVIYILRLPHGRKEIMLHHDLLK